MLKLDPFSESILFQCDRCQRIGELCADMAEEEGEIFCWNCLREINQKERQEAVLRVKKYAVK